MRLTRRNLIQHTAVLIAGSLVAVFGSGGCRKTGQASDFITLRATEYAFTPATLSVHVNQHVRLRFENHGAIQHNVVIPNIIWSDVVDPGKTVELGFTAPSQPGDYPYYCAVPGHRELGMEGTLHVTS